MNKLPFIGRLIFSLPMIFFGIGHFTNVDVMAGRIPLPGGEFWVYFTGIALMAAALSVITRILAVQALLGVAFMLLVFNVTMHFPHAGAEVGDLVSKFNMTPEQAGEFKTFNGIVGMMNFMIIGAAIALAGYVYKED